MQDWYLISPRSGRIVSRVTTHRSPEEVLELFGTNYEVTTVPTQRQLDEYQQWLEEMRAE